MEYRINKCNRNYIMIDRWTPFLEIQKLQNSKKELSQREVKYLKSLWYILNTMEYINQEKRRRNEDEIEEIAINKNSDFFKILLSRNKIRKPEKITLEQIIHASLISIEKQEWYYYHILSNIIITYGLKKLDTLSYNEFLENHGTEITEYIVNSNQIISNINNQKNDRIVYLYNGVELQERKILKERTNKVKTRTI